MNRDLYFLAGEVIAIVLTGIFYFKTFDNFSKSFKSFLFLDECPQPEKFCKPMSHSQALCVVWTRRTLAKRRVHGLGTNPSLDSASN
jgi:hypothetical protein